MHYEWRPEPGRHPQIEVHMSDTKQGQSGKPNKFSQQNQHAEERKAADTPRRGEPAQEPRTDETTNDKQKTEQTRQDK